MADFLTVVVTGQYLLPDLTPRQGQIVFRPPNTLQAPDPDLIVSGPAVAILDSTGSFSIELLACDDPTLNPQGWVYGVTEKFVDFANYLRPDAFRQYSIQPVSTVSPIDIVDLAPADPNEAVYVAVVGPEGPRGPAGGEPSQYDFANLSTWTAAHGLGRLPASLTVYDAAGQISEPGVFVNSTLFTITYPSPATGSVVLS